MRGVFMGHLSFYNKNQIRDKLLLVLIFLKQVRWQSKQKFDIQGMIIGQHK